MSDMSQRLANSGKLEECDSKSSIPVVLEVQLTRSRDWFQGMNDSKSSSYHRNTEMNVTLRICGAEV